MEVKDGFYVAYFVMDHEIVSIPVDALTITWILKNLAQMHSFIGIPPAPAGVYMAERHEHYSPTSMTYMNLDRVNYFKYSPATQVHMQSSSQTKSPG